MTPIASDFTACRAWLMPIEGGYTVDQGGPTQEGIEQREYDAWCKLNNSTSGPVKDASEATLTAIYKAQYWNPYCPFLPPGVNLVFFDTSVNQGPGIGVVFLQRSLGVEADGHFGVVTAAAVKAIGQPGGVSAKTVIDEMTDMRVHRYKGTRDFAIDGDGWLSRAAKCKATAYQMAGLAP